MRVGVRTDVGLVRESNEDGYHVGERVWVVADGMGGHQAGEVASHLALETLSQAGLGEGDQGGDGIYLVEAIKEANRRIYDEARRNPAFAGMGTTLTAAVYDDGCLYIGHVGDSRAYLVREGAIIQLTEDHSVVAELLRDGTLSAEEARVHPHRNYLTRALGIEREVAVDLIKEGICEGDRLILTTDGLTNMVEDEEILEVVMRMKDPQESCDLLTEMARRRGGTDNITVLIVEF